MTKKSPHDLLTAALQYAALGYAVVPVHSIKNDGSCSCKDGKSCNSPGKHPRTQNGIYGATRDPDKIESFLGQMARCEYWDCDRPLQEFWSFLRVRKKYRLVPVFIMMIIFGSLIVLAKGSAVAPFIYTLF